MTDENTIENTEAKAEVIDGLVGLFSALWEKLRQLGKELDREEATKKKLEKLEDQDA